MKLVFSKTNLAKAVGIVMKAVPAKTTMNILECILIDATTNEIKFTANDMELGIETIVEGEIIEKGKVAIDAKIFSEIVRKLPDNEICIETDSNYTSLITCEKSKFNIAGKSGDDFSYLPIIEKDKFITLSQFTLRETINQTLFSIAMNDNNKMMTGELFEVANGILKVVGLDGHRIAIRNIELTSHADDVKVVVPERHFLKSVKFYRQMQKMPLQYTLQIITFYLNLTIPPLYPVLLKESISELTRCFPVIMKPK